MKTFSILAGMASLASAHMQMTHPLAFRSKFNPAVSSASIDYSMTAPLRADGNDFPCKGYHKDFGTESGKPTVEWTAGESYNMTIDGGAPHNGGSCQASLSTDRGASWTVIHSYLGNCPVMGSSSYSFAVPADAPTGDVIFAWTWFNWSGNREMYMNCAAVNIKAGSPKAKRAVQVPFSSRPAMFEANISNGLCTTEGTDVEFPNPGPDVTDKSSRKGKPVKCRDNGKGSQPRPGSGDGKPAPAPAPSASKPAQEPAPTTPAEQPQQPEQPEQPEQPIASEPAEQKPSATIPGGVFITTPVTEETAPVENPAVPAPTEPAATAPVDVPPPAQSSAAAQPSSSPAPGSGSGMAPGSKCSDEDNGLFNCVDGKQFQRCASRRWSVLQPVAPGTKCQVGQSMFMSISVAKE